MVYALDFDGVVIDSINECLNTSYEALTLIERENGRLLPQYPSLEQIKLFKARRGLVRPSRNFLALWEWVLNFPDLNHSQESFESFATSYSDKLFKFENAFHYIRSEMLNGNPQMFIKENPLFPDVKELWNELPKPLYIVSTKDEESISVILKFHNLNISGIYGRGTGSKVQTIENLAKFHSVSIGKTFFVDDNSQHALDVQANGAQVGLALWGYGPIETFKGVKLKSFKEVLEFFQSVPEVENS